MNSDVVTLLNILSLLKRESVLTPRHHEKLVEKVKSAIVSDDWSDVEADLKEVVVISFHPYAEKAYEIVTKLKEVKQ